jgi:hypothetical protein
LDLGGASTQITFHPDESILAGLFPLNIAQISHDLYTHSYLYYGADQARLRFYENLIAAAAGPLPSVPVTNPCFPTGFTTTPDPNNPTVEFTGSSDWNACVAAVTKLITDYQPLAPSSPTNVQCLHSDHERCTFNGVYQPQIPREMTFIAMSGFYYDWSYFQLSTGAGKLSSSVASLAAAAEIYCNLDAEGQAAYNNSLSHPSPAPFCYNFCFGAAYSQALLVEGYQLPEKNTKVEVVSNINGNDVGWAYGSMLYQINKLGWSYEPPVLAIRTLMYIFGAAAAALLLATMVLLVKLIQLRKNKSEYEEHLIV